MIEESQKGNSMQNIKFDPIAEIVQAIFRTDKKLSREFFENSNLKKLGKDFHFDELQSFTLEILKDICETLKSKMEILSKISKRHRNISGCSFYLTSGKFYDRPSFSIIIFTLIIRIAQFPKEYIYIKTLNAIMPISVEWNLTLYIEDKEFLMLMTQHEEVLKTLYRYNLLFQIKPNHEEKREQFRKHLDQIVIRHFQYLPIYGMLLIDGHLLMPQKLFEGGDVKRVCRLITLLDLCIQSFKHKYTKFEGPMHLNLIDKKSKIPVMNSSVFGRELQEKDIDQQFINKFNDPQSWTQSISFSQEIERVKGNRQGQQDFKSEIFQSSFKIIKEIPLYQYGRGGRCYGRYLMVEDEIITENDFKFVNTQFK